MPPECSTPSCTGRAQAKGLCWRCYGRLRRNGDPLKTGQHGGRRDQVVGPSEPPDPRPVKVLRSELERSRALDASFALAWSNAVATALASLDRTLAAEWRSALADTRSAWRSAYFREAPKVEWRRNLLDVVEGPDENWFSYRRSAPRTISTGTRNDGPSTLEPVVVRWCRS
jgi:hypothetical protein